MLRDSDFRFEEGFEISPRFRRSLEERLGTPVNLVDPRTAAALTDRIDGSPSLLDALTPLVGLLVRDGEAA